MDQTLLAAAWKGDIAKLEKIFNENREALYQMCLVPFAQTPLHIAALAGKTDFVKAVLELMPDFAWLRDQNGLSPIHIASAKGHVDIVKVLLSFDLNQCLLTDNEGRTPVHYAVCKGKVDVIDEFFSRCPQSLEEVTAQDESVLHLAVKAGQFDALRTLLEMLTACGKTEMLLDAENKEGKTVSDIAAAKKHPQVQHFLKKYKAHNVEETQADNGIEEEDGQVAVQSHEIDMDMPEDGIEEKADKSEGPPISPGTGKESEFNNLLLVATALIVTVTYQAGLSPPSNMWKEGTKLNVRCLFGIKGKGNSPHSPTQGCPAAARYYWFTILNTAGFVSSLVCMLYLLCGTALRVSSMLLGISTTTLLATYIISLASFSPDRLSNIAVIFGSASFIIFMPLLYRALRFCLQKKARNSRKRRRQRPVEGSKKLNISKLKGLARIVFRTFIRNENTSYQL